MLLHKSNGSLIFYKHVKCVPDYSVSFVDMIGKTENNFEQHFQVNIAT